MNEKRVAKYLREKGCVYSNWNVDSLKKAIENTDFKGEETGELVFNKDKRGSYIIFKPTKCYID